MNAGWRGSLWVILLSLAIALGFGAWALLPREGVIYPPPTVDISYLGPSSATDPIDRVVTTIDHTAAGSTVTVDTYTFTDSTPADDTIALVLQLGPGLAYGGPCHSGTCEAFPKPAGPSRQVWIHFDRTFHPGFGYAGRARFLITGQSLGWSSNGLHVEGTLPNVVLESSDSNRGITDEVSLAQYAIPSYRSFDWIGGPGPSLLGTRYATFAGPTSSPLSFDGTNRERERDDSIHTFLAGALLGIAGGAAIGALQELAGRNRHTSRLPDTQESVRRGEDLPESPDAEDPDAPDGWV